MQKGVFIQGNVKILKDSSEKLLWALLITQISLVFQSVLHLSNQFLIGVIRDFWTFSEISKKSLTIVIECLILHQLIIQMILIKQN